MLLRPGCLTDSTVWNVTRVPADRVDSALLLAWNHNLTQDELDRGDRRDGDQGADDAEERGADRGHVADLDRAAHHLRVDQVVFHLLVDDEEDHAGDADAE